MGEGLGGVCNQEVLLILCLQQASHQVHYTDYLHFIEVSDGYYSWFTDEVTEALSPEAFARLSLQ